MNVSTPSPAPEQEDSLQSQLQQAQALMQAKDYTSAIHQLIPIVKSMDAADARPEAVFALMMMADAQRFSGYPADAYQNYVVAAQIDPGQAGRLQKHILNCLSELKAPLNLPTFEQHLIEYFHDTTLDNTAVDQLCRERLINKFKLDEDAALIEFSDILSDEFLIEAVTHLVLADPVVEVFLHQLRDQVFTLANENGLVEALQPMTLALANHADLVEYVFPISDSNRVVLLGFRTLFEAEIRQESDVSEHLGYLLLYSMFEPINELAFFDQISISDLSQWSEAIAPFIKKTLVDRSVELGLDDAIMHLETVTEEVSKSVMAQYEENPYPRWEHVFVAEKKIPYLDLYPSIKPVTQKVRKFSKQLDCLIAGCGTGKQPLWLIANCRDLNVTALDLSMPSLRYAKRKSIELDLADNIKFYQGDILDLDCLEKKFDIIECSGVLHHMQDPEAGLEALLRRLRGNGIVRLGLYSQIARDKIQVNQARVHSPQYVDLEAIRSLRANYLQNLSNLPHLARDFFTASECRDLLFHVQEHQFDLLQIQQLLLKHNLTFLGFSHLTPEVTGAYRNRFSDNPDFLNLANWHQFETENPYVFKGMYQFHCQKLTS